jgi:hypothetical protein
MPRQCDRRRRSVVDHDDLNDLDVGHRLPKRAVYRPTNRASEKPVQAMGQRLRPQGANG